MIKGAIFDVDGTLLDSMGIWEDAGVRYLRSVHTEPKEGLNKILFPMSIEEAAGYMKSHYHLPQDISEIVQGILGTVRDFYFTEAALKRGAEEVLAALAKKGISVVAATSSDREHIEAAFERLGIRQYFQRIFTCTEVGAGKDIPLIYEKAAAYLGACPGDVCVFEDALYALQTAKRAGFWTVGVYDRYSADMEEELRACADRYVKELTELTTE